MNGTVKPSHSRIFLALWPNAAEQAALAGWQASLKASCKGRLMRQANLHATLAFIGAARAQQVAAAMDAAKQVRGQAFVVHWDTLCYWPHSHIVHAALSQIPAALIALEAQLRSQLAIHGFELAQRDFLPHVTLVRNARCGEHELPEVVAVEWRVLAFSLMQSVNDGEGTHYIELQRFPLAGEKFLTL